MENKNEQQKQNLIWIFVILVLLIICIIMFIQNKKIEKMMAIINRNYDPYELSFDMRRTDNNMYLIERKMNKRFMEFAREMEELRYIIDDMMDKNYRDFVNFDSKEIKKEEFFEKKQDSKKQEKKDKKNKEFKKESKRSLKKYENINQFEIETDYDEDDKEYEVEIKLPNDFNMDDIDIKLKDSVLTIKIEKEIKNKSDDGDYYKHGSFYQSFTIPKTKATTKDIKKELKGRKLEIKVPII